MRNGVFGGKCFGTQTILHKGKKRWWFLPCKAKSHSALITKSDMLSQIFHLDLWKPQLVEVHNSIPTKLIIYSKWAYLDIDTVQAWDTCSDISVKILRCSPDSMLQRA